MHALSHQLKVFVAIRKEAFTKFDETTSMAQQYRGNTVDIVYSPASLREIFISKYAEHCLCQSSHSSHCR